MSLSSCLPCRHHQLRPPRPNANVTKTKHVNCYYCGFGLITGHRQLSNSIPVYRHWNIHTYLQTHPPCKVCVGRMDSLISSGMSVCCSCRKFALLWWTIWFNQTLEVILKRNYCNACPVWGFNWWMSVFFQFSVIKFTFWNLYPWNSNCNTSSTQSPPQSPIKFKWPFGGQLQFTALALAAAKRVRVHAAAISETFELRMAGIELWVGGRHCNCNKFHVKNNIKNNWVFQTGKFMLLQSLNLH